MSSIFDWISEPSRVPPAFSVGLLILASLLVPQCGWAVSEAKNCTPEPTTNMPIAYGDVLSGSNCVITVADLDSFQFVAHANDLIRLIAVKVGGGYYAAPCIELLDPTGVPVLQPATVCNTSIQIDQSLTTAGKYTILVTEQNNDDTVNYNLSVTRVFPFPGNATAMIYGQVLSDEINPPADLDAYTFPGTAGDQVRINATKTGGGYYAQVCIEWYQPDSTLLGSKSCGTSVQLPDTTLTKTGTYMLLVSEAGNDDTVSYNLGLQCLAGKCLVPPQCNLKDVVTYDSGSGTLNMNFTVSNTYPVTWNAWLSYRNSVVQLWSMPQPITISPISVSKTYSPLAKVGKAGVLSTFTTPNNGITCNSWTVVNTGSPGAANEEELDDGSSSGELQ